MNKILQQQIRVLVITFTILKTIYQIYVNPSSCIFFISGDTLDGGNILDMKFHCEWFSHKIKIHADMKFLGTT